MKNILKYSVLAILFLGMLNACKQQIPYTKKVEKDYKLENENLRELQFYLVGDIVLTKGSSEDDSRLEDGDILISEQQNLDKVIFKTGTQGLFVKKIGDNKIAFSFEKSDDYFLVFGATTVKGTYKLQASEWTSSGRGKIEYGGEEYFVSKASKTTYITIKVKKSKKYNTNQRIASGRKV